MKISWKVLLCILLFFQSSFGQDNYEKNKEDVFQEIFSDQGKYNRKSYFFFNIGIIEIGGVGIGHQFTPEISFGVKAAASWIGSSSFVVPQSASGIGFNLNYHYCFLLFNTVSLDYITYFYSSFDWERKIMLGKIDEEPTVKGHFFELNFGHQTIDDSGFNFFWAMGICCSAAKESNVLWSPSLKIGFNYNFMRKEK